MSKFATKRNMNKKTNKIKNIAKYKKTRKKHKHNDVIDILLTET